MPKVSIIVPCWGVEKYLDRCVESLVNQTLKDIEIILVDDVSPDRVPEMCDEWARKDDRIVVVHKKENGGLGMACNSGIDVAKGEYIAFCDSDDWVAFSAYEEMYNAAKERNADMVMTGIQTVDEYGRVTPMNQADKYEVLDDRRSILSYAMDMIATEPSDVIQRRVAMSAKIVLYRRSMIERYGLRFESERRLISEDLIWNIDNLGHASCVVTLPKTFYFYYNNTASLSKKVRTDRFGYLKTMRQELIRRTAELGYPSDVVIRIDRMFLAEIRHYSHVLLLSDLDRKKKVALVKEMLYDDMTRSVLKTYPIYKGSKSHTVAFMMMKYRWIWGLEMLFGFNFCVSNMLRKFISGGVKLSLSFSYVWDKLWSPLYKRAMKHCGEGVYLRPMSCDLKGLWNMSIGDGTSIPKGSTFYCTIAPLTIGKKVIFGPKPTIITGDHRIDIIGKYIIDVIDEEKGPEHDAPVVIEDDVWCGANVTILKGVTIGRGSVVAAGAVVTKSFPPYSIIGGVPAKLLKMRFTPEEIAEHESMYRDK